MKGGGMMKEILTSSIFLGAMITLLAFELGRIIQRKLKLVIFNPILIGTVAVIAFLLLADISYEEYNEGAKYITYLLTPATVCLAVPFYEQLAVFKKNVGAIIAGITAGVLTSLGSIFVFALLFSFSTAEYATLLPKSITTAIGIVLAEELGGMGTITALMIIMTGLAGNIVAVPICKLFGINNPVAKGVAIGTSAHVVGTAKAIELGEVEGAISSVAIAVSGLMTVLGASIFVRLI